MATRPLLIFPRPELAARLKRSAGPTTVHFPGFTRQRRRLTPQFRRLQEAFEATRAELRAAPIGVEPERVLVLETIGSIESFITAVRHTAGMEWLGEWEEEDIPADEYFYRDKERQKALSGRLFLVMSDQEAMRQLIGLWRRFQRDRNARFDRGLTKWRALFSQLRRIRFWDVEDRLDSQLIELWRIELRAGQERLRFQAEIWFMSNGQRRANAAENFATLLREANGLLLGQTIVPEIAYHGIVGEIPRARAEQILDNPYTRLIRCDQVMFFRPLGQASVPSPQDEPGPARPLALEAPLPQGNPVLSLLDGLPLENHDLLRNRLTVDDPDNWSADYLAQDRLHGTGMASLIINGELDADGVPLPRPIYARPILRPARPSWSERPVEVIPDNIDPVDLVHRAIRRIFEGENAGEPAVAPTVRMVNFSICDRSRPFDRSVSPLARLLDYLAWKYKVLILVSAGNQDNEIQLDVPRQNFVQMTAGELERDTFLALDRQSLNRRILSPSEAINVLTIGAVHADSSTVQRLGNRVDPVTSGLPSPLNPIGFGFRRSVKPDVLFEGGRQLYTEKLGTTHEWATICVDTTTTRAPGQRMAAPGLAGDLSATRYTRGTSNATAMASRTAVLLHDELEALREEPRGDQLEERYIPVILKTLLVHGASWGENQRVLERILASRLNGRSPREYLARFLGYGRCNPGRVQSCTAQRATMLGWGELRDGEAHVYRIPLPPSLSAIRIWRRLTVTLTWLTPIEPLNQKYRSAVLWFEPPTEDLLIDRKEVDARAAQRGTVQHEILEGEQALAFVDGRWVMLQVNCRAYAGKLTELVPYSIAASLEVAPETAIPLYEEIRTRLMIRIPIAPGRAE